MSVTEDQTAVQEEPAAARQPLLSLVDARNRILSAMHMLGDEKVTLTEALGRTLAFDVVAKLARPPASMSAMDGYAIRRADAEALPATLTAIGVSRAGAGYHGRIGAGQCVRIFTGAPLPDGADCIAFQEDTEVEGSAVTVFAVPPPGEFIRRQGMDLEAGSVALPAGTRISARALSLIAASGNTAVRVRRRPTVAVASTGDEIVDPGQPIGRDQIVDANRIGLCAALAGWGAVPVDLGIVPDRLDAVAALAERAAGADLLLTSGGASVGDHDLVRRGLSDRGLALDFWKIAMRPGKPLMFGHIDRLPVIGLPGNPVSAFVCSLLFVRPAIAAMLGTKEGDPVLEPAILTRHLPMNDQREDYLRATLARDAEGRLTATPFPVQDSGMLANLAWSHGLVRRAPYAPASAEGDTVEVIRFVDDGF